MTTGTENNSDRPAAACEVSDRAASVKYAAVAGDHAAMIEIRGARARNLKNIDVEIPLGKLVVITGVSGSGKSSLAVPVLTAAGQRRVLEGVSTAAQRRLNRQDLPEVDSITHVPPPVLVRWDSSPRQQETGATVATLLDLERPLEELFVRAGHLVCPECQIPVERLTPESLAERMTTTTARHRTLIGFALTAESRKTGPKTLVQQGIVRAVLKDQLIDLTQLAAFPRGAKGDLIVDRLLTGPGHVSRWQESLELAFRLGSGRCVIYAECEVDEPVAVQIDGRRWLRQEFSTHLVCPQCGLSFEAPETLSFRTGSDPTSRGLQIHGRSLPEIAVAPLDTLQGWLNDWLAAAAGDLSPETHDLLAAIRARVQGLVDLGMSRLTLQQTVAGLAPGTCRRILLVNALNRDLPETLLIVEEPTAGLHPAEVPPLVRCLRQALTGGRSIVVVEHSPELVAAADQVIEMGPGSGERGGQVVAQGSPQELRLQAATVTAQAFTSRQQPFEPQARRACPDWIEIRGLRGRGFKGIDLRIPLGGLTVITGASDSGQSALVLDALPQILRTESETISGHDQFECDSREIAYPVQAITVTASPLSASRNSTVVTRLQVFDGIRAVFAETADARRRGWTATQFSYSSPQGLRCPHCRGRGIHTVDLAVLPDAAMTCPECGGTRYRSEVQDVRYRGLSIVDVLEMTVAEAQPVFRNYPHLLQRFQALSQLGLDYLVLGQPATRLSGGEAQRVRLASSLTARASMPQLYLCDEPSQGIHPTDVPRLAGCFRQLADLGQTIVIADHQRELLEAADWILELRRTGGTDDSLQAIQGTPADLAAARTGLTGEILNGRLWYE